jgi:hypothetical protein
MLNAERGLLFFWERVVKMLAWTRQNLCAFVPIRTLSIAIVPIRRGRVTPATTRRTAARAHARSSACPRQKVSKHELQRSAKFQAQQLARGACGGANR